MPRNAAACALLCIFRDARSLRSRPHARGVQHWRGAEAPAHGPCAAGGVRLEEPEDHDYPAAESYLRAQSAVREGRFAKEIVAVEIASRKGGPATVVKDDEEPFAGDVTKLPSLKPAFQKDGGTVTRIGSVELLTVVFEPMLAR